MLQIKTFTLPDQEAEANEFLAVTKPDGVNYNEAGGIFSRRVIMTVSYDDGMYPNEYAVVELRNLIQAAGAAKTQQIVALGVLNMEIAELEKREVDMNQRVIDLQTELDGLDKYKDKGPYNLKNHNLEKAKKDASQIAAGLSEKRASREAVQNAIEGQDAKMSVVKGIISELRA